MKIRKKQIANDISYVFYSKVLDEDNNEFYFTGTCNTVTEFKNKIKLYYATTIDEIKAYKLHFSYIGNVGRINGVDDDKYIKV